MLVRDQNEYNLTDKEHDASNARRRIVQKNMGGKAWTDALGRSIDTVRSTYVHPSSHLTRSLVKGLGFEATQTKRGKKKHYAKKDHTYLTHGIELPLSFPWRRSTIRVVLFHGGSLPACPQLSNFWRDARASVAESILPVRDPGVHSHY